MPMFTTVDLGWSLGDDVYVVLSSLPPACLCLLCVCVSPATFCTVSFSFSFYALPPTHTTHTLIPPFSQTIILTHLHCLAFWLLQLILWIHAAKRKRLFFLPHFKPHRRNEFCFPSIPTGEKLSTAPEQDFSCIG